ncbi:hypothetical protein [Hahella sp. NBU794]|uniref:hypothetical protein n=1 Tax=Hahella sp. NBU794 TaxID=3422590 RepID=UPI003D6FB602
MSSSKDIAKAACASSQDVGRISVRDIFMFCFTPPPRRLQAGAPPPPPVFH